ncbi:MAG: beta-L-arabinofuranosidase domain-containing protein [Candidatus Latescibacterota bacterium]
MVESGELIHVFSRKLTVKRSTERPIMTARSLRKNHFTPFPLGSIRPSGWLERQLYLQANSLSGKLDEFWPDIRESQWFGGNSEAWERAPYWLDGVIPLAFLLDDAVLKDKVHRYMDTILTSQHEDGWLGPRTMVAGAGQAGAAKYDIWAQFLAMKALVQYHDATGDDRVIHAMERALRKVDRHIDRAPLFDWGQFRWFEALIAIFWLYERTEAPWLLDLAVKLHAQGFDWGAFFEHWPLTEPTEKGRWNFAGHVVNNAMAIKSHALWGRMSDAERDRRAVAELIAKLDEFHGSATGVFTGDECLAGRSPVQGTELCAVVEYMYSLEVLLAVLGDPSFGDRLEKIAFNALPATFSPDMWSHQYDQQVNQVACTIAEGRTWNTNGPDANIFGVEPNYGCCTANLSQGWPKFAAHLWMRTEDGGIAAVAYAPSCVTTEIDGVPVTVDLETEYPFRDRLTFTVTAERAVTFPLLLRIPSWADGAEIKAPGETMRPTPGTFERIERTWGGTTQIVLVLPMAPSLLPRDNGAVAIERGPLVYSLKIGEDWRRVHEDQPYRELPHADWEIYPTTPWNYALDINEKTLSEGVVLSECPVGACPFSPEGAPVSLRVKGRRLPEWQLINGSAQETPERPLQTQEPLEELTLIPYGCTNLRITEFPVAKDRWEGTDA